MKRFYRIFLLLLALTFLTTYNPSKLNIFPKKENSLFKIKNIEVINNNIISEEKIRKKLTHIYDKNILFIKRRDIEESLKKIDFLNKIEVKKKYPKTVIIKIYETKPIAFLFKKEKKYLIDTASNLVTLIENIPIKELPNVFGDGAEFEFIEFFNKLKKNKFPNQRIKNYYYFQINRWDIQLFNDQIIKFPANKQDEAIQQIIKLINREDFKNYNIIDLRIHGKIIVE